MAYMSQENKAVLSKEIAKVVPPTWKWTLAVRHHSTLVLTVREADVDLIGEDQSWQRRNEPRPTYCRLNEYHLSGHYDGKLLKIFEGIRAAMNVGNHDRSDVQSDYFDVGWYVTISIGDYKSPFRCAPCQHDRIKPNGDCAECGVFVTSVPGYTKHAVAYAPKGMPKGLSEAEELAWLKSRVAELEAGNAR